MTSSAMKCSRQPTFTWSSSGVGAIDDTGLFTAPAGLSSDPYVTTTLLTASTPRSWSCWHGPAHDHQSSPDGGHAGGGRG